MDTSTILRFACVVAVKSAAILVVACGVAAALRRRSPAARHLVWALAVAAVLLLPIASAWGPAYAIGSFKGIEDRAAEAAPAGPAEMPDVSFPDDDRRERTVTNTAHVQSATVTRTPVSNRAFWLVAWATGTCVVALFGLIAPLARRRFERGAVRVHQGPLFDAATRLKLELGLRREVSLYVGPAVPMPLTYGTIRPRLLLPTSAAQWDRDQLRSALLHELAHVKRMDCATQALAHLACAVYWFNPLAWWAASRLRVEREGACDDCVLGRGAPPERYAEHLLAVARTLRGFSSTSIGTIAMARPSGLRRRITRILNRHADHAAVSYRRSLVAGVVALLMVVSIACAQVAPRVTAPATSSSVLPASAPSTQPRVAASQTTTSPLADRTIRVIALDNATGKPLVGANVDYQFTPSNGRVQTDAAGQVTLELKGGSDPLISVWMSHYINQRMHWRTGHGNPPTEYVFRLDPTSVIGGKVVDGAGQPVAGANVEIYVNGRTENVGDFYVESPWINRAVVTGHDGTWQFERVPPNAPSIKVAVWDYQHLAGEYFFLKPYTPLADLRSKAAVFTLPQSVPVTGTVLNPFSGKPIPKATITFGPDQSASNKIPPLTADADGKFTIGVRPGTKLFMTVSASNYRSEVHEEVIDDKPMAIEFDLSPVDFVK